MKNLSNYLSIFLIIGIISACSTKPDPANETTVRQAVDTIGFAHLAWQMDSVLSRIETTFQDELLNAKQPKDNFWKLAICPHDDYAYASWLYPATLNEIKAKTIIIFGVAHRAANFNIEDKLVFDSFDYWNAPYGTVKISPLREGIIRHLPENSYIVHDSLQTIEHSVEALVPFLQYQNRQTEIISILVPYMDRNKIENFSNLLSYAIFKELKARKLNWGNDVALLITSDAVHYGDEEWGGLNYARFGTDSAGTQKALNFENEIIEKCFTGELTQAKTEKFMDYTVSKKNHKQYIWTWCGRYCIPLGMQTAEKLSKLLKEKPLDGIKIGYSTSISQVHIPVNDLRMGTTANATQRHWVGYPAVGFK